MIYALVSIVDIDSISFSSLHDALCMNIDANYFRPKNIAKFLYCNFIVTPCVYIPREGSALELAYKFAYAKPRVEYTS